MPRNILSSKEKARRALLGMGGCKVIKVGNERVLEYCEAWKNDKMYIPQGVTELGEKSLKVWYNCDIEIPETVQKSSLDVLVAPPYGVQSDHIPREYKVSLTNPPLDLVLAFIVVANVKLELHGDCKNVILALVLKNQIYGKGDREKDFAPAEGVWDVHGLVVQDYLTKEIVEYVRSCVYAHNGYKFYVGEQGLNFYVGQQLMQTMFCFEKWTRALGY